MPPMGGRPAGRARLSASAALPDGSRVARRPNLYDVAREAGVSHQTVSRVVNGHPGVLPATRARVRAAIAVVGYRPNSAARALVTRRSGAIGIISARSPVFGRMSTVLAVQEAAREAGLSAGIHSLSPADLARGPVDAEQLTDGVDGVVVIASWDPLAAVGAELAAFVPTVIVGRPAGSAPPGVCTVSIDQEAGARAAVAHLAGLGHRRILHIGGPSTFSDARTREAGYRSEMAGRGLPTLAVPRGDWTAESGYAIGRRLPPDDIPDAVFVANDLMALGFLRALRERDIDVPGDISVVGFDDVAGSAFFDPPLTTVRPDYTGLGRRAVAALEARLAGGAGAVAVGVGEAAEVPDAGLRPELVVRASTAAATGRAAVVGF
ncbi:LacI family DNA-binding transcriptional regulator [Nakamurella flavida]|uniref:LacI family DNA-binding transcriptional regulator n=1 Tax=Nakamurella flavida TaxID=363630 RepID=A0A939C390_9ACTN|nr:LacI family DNA-binding transcriptional regulator [Nakamurella flavida]MBM9476836.1 LacI family DNA-binding transcriptional regulator [Nakamurella flavida]MDP9778722.1 DNA-binding LacI/PurR family transcriptional regulator [Nakamurella flavida]